MELKDVLTTYRSLFRLKIKRCSVYHTVTCSKFSDKDTQGPIWVQYLWPLHDSHHIVQFVGEEWIELEMKLQPIMTCHQM